MRILLSVAVVMVSMAVYTDSSEGQYIDGYRFGSGVRFSRFGFNRGGLFAGGFSAPRDRPPYFAQFPPVYYSGIVRRPYGISPYAVPPGIAPIELSVPQPLSVKNPFFDGQVSPASDVNTDSNDDNDDKIGNKVTWKPNPYIDSVVISE